MLILWLVFLKVLINQQKKRTKMLKIKTPFCFAVLSSLLLAKHVLGKVTGCNQTVYNRIAILPFHPSLL